MATKAAVATEPATGAVAEPAKTKSGNLSLAELGQRMTKGRQKATPSAAPKTAPATAQPATAPAKSEQADGAEAKTDLSKLETDDSAALAAEAGAVEGTEAKAEEQAGEPAGQQAGEEAEAAEEAEPPKAVRDLQKRVGKLTEQRNEAREEIAELKDRLQQLEAGGAQTQQRPAHPAESTFGGDRSVQEIDGTLAGVDAFLTWADTNPDGGSYAEGEKTYELTADEVRSYRRKCNAESIRLNAKREARLETLRADFDTRRASSHAEAVKLYPWVEQKASPEFQEALSVIRENPALLQRPDFELIVARQVAGQRLEREALKKTKAGQQGGRPAGQSRNPAPVVTFSPSAAPKGEGKAAATVSAAESQFKSSGRESDLSKLLAQKRLARLEAAKG